MFPSSFRLKNGMLSLVFLLTSVFWEIAMYQIQTLEVLLAPRRSKTQLQRKDQKVIPRSSPVFPVHTVKVK